MARKKNGTAPTAVAGGIKWPVDAVMRIEKLIPYARNSRMHSPSQIDEIAASIREWGFTIPVLIDEGGTIIAGHARVMAAKKLGILEIPVRIAKGWSEAQKRAYVIADNKLALNADWNEAMLSIELRDLQQLDFPLELIGFSMPELVSFTTSPDAGAPGQSLTDSFGIVPFSVLNAREGWWQDRKRAWLMLGIKSEIGRGESPGSSARVGADDDPTYRTIGGRKRKPNAVPGGAPMPLDRAKNVKAATSRNQARSSQRAAP